MTMLEKVALALLNDDREWMGASEHMRRLEDLLDPKEPEFRRRQARAAIETMREPTEVMLKALQRPGHVWERDKALMYWQTMIDAALKEQLQTGDAVRRADVGSVLEGLHGAATGHLGQGCQRDQADDDNSG